MGLSNMPEDVRKMLRSDNQLSDREQWLEFFATFKVISEAHKDESFQLFAELLMTPLLLLYQDTQKTQNRLMALESMFFTELELDKESDGFPEAVAEATVEQLEQLLRDIPEKILEMDREEES